MDFDFNLILVPVVLVLFALWLLDKLVLKQRATRGKGNESFIIAWAYDFWPILAIVLVVRSFLYEPFTIPSESMKPGLEVGDFIVVNKYEYGVRLPLIHTKIIENNLPAHGDVIVFRFPNDPKIAYIKRVIGVAGDKVSIMDGQILINGQPHYQEAVKDIKLDFPVSNGQDSFNIVADAKLYQERIGDKSYTIQQMNVEQAEHNAKVLIESRKQQTGKAFPTMAQNAEFVVPDGHYFVMGDNRDQSEDSRAWGFVPEANLIGKATYIWTHKEPGFNLPSFSRNGSIQ